MFFIFSFLAGCSQKPDTAKEAFDAAHNYLAKGDVSAYFNMTVNADERFRKLATLDEEKQKKLSEFYREIGNDYIPEFIESDCDSSIEQRRYNAQEGCSFMVSFNHKSNKKKNIELEYYYAMKVDGEWKVDFPF